MDMTPLQDSFWRGNCLPQNGSPSTIYQYMMEQSRYGLVSHVPMGHNTALILRWGLSKSLQKRAWPSAHQFYCFDRLRPQGRYDGTVYQPVVLHSFCQLCSIPKKSLMNRLVCDNRSSLICNTFMPTPTLLYANTSRFPMFRCLASWISKTNATSGFDPVAHLKMSLKCNRWSKSNKASLA